MLRSSIHRIQNKLSGADKNNSGVNKIRNKTSQQLAQNTKPTIASRDDIEKNRDDYMKHQPIKNLLYEQLITDNDNKTYIYRGMTLDNIDILKTIIYNEGMLVSKAEECEYICFTPGGNKEIAIKHAGGGDDNIGVIFQIHFKTIENANIHFYGRVDTVEVIQDIPPEVIQQGHVFLINYKHDCLTQIDLATQNTSNTTTDEIADILKQENLETINTTTDEDPKDNKYNAVHIAKTGRKAISHGANRIPGGPGSAKIGVEAIFGKTLGGEKLSPTQQKLYGRGSSLSLLGWGLGRLGVHTGHLRLGLPLPILSILSSAVMAAAQASIVGGDSNIGKIFKAKMMTYLEDINKYIGKLKGTHIDQQTQEQIAAMEANIEEVKNTIQQTTDKETADMIKEIVVDLPVNKADGK